MNGIHTETKSEPTEKKKIGSGVIEEIAQRSRLRREWLLWEVPETLGEQGTVRRACVAGTYTDLGDQQDSAAETGELRRSEGTRLWRRPANPRKACAARLRPGCQLKGSVKKLFYREMEN